MTKLSSPTNGGTLTENCLKIQRQRWWWFRRGIWGTARRVCGVVRGLRLLEAGDVRGVESILRVYCKTLISLEPTLALGHLLCIVSC